MLISRRSRSIAGCASLMVVGTAAVGVRVWAKNGRRKSPTLAIVNRTSRARGRELTARRLWHGGLACGATPILARQFLSTDCQLTTTVKVGALWRLGAATRKRCPSSLTLHSV